MWEGPTIGNANMLNILTMIASACAIIGSAYALFQKMKAFFTQRFAEVDARFEKVDARFEKMDERFEILEHRIFELAMGKSFKDILKEENERAKKEKENRY